MYSFIGRLADRLISLSAIVGTLGLLAEVLIILVDVIGRQLGHPLYGSQDLVTMVMVLVVFGGMALADREGGHISVDLLENKFSPAFNSFLDGLAAFFGAVIFSAMAWAVWESSKLSLLLNLSTNLLRLPKAWFQWALCIFALITALGMILRVLDKILMSTRLAKKD